MKKISIILVVCMLLSILMTACLDAEEPQGSETEELTTEKMTENDENTSEETEESDFETEESSKEEYTGESGEASETGSEQASESDSSDEETTAEQIAIPDVNTVDKAVEIAAKAQSNVTGGTLSVTKGSYFNETTSFSFGEGYLKAITTTPDGERTVHATLDENGKVCYVLIDPSNFLAPISINAQANARYANGPAVDLTNYINESVEVCGAYDMVDFFYLQYPYTSEEDITVQESIENGKYSFSYSMEGPAMFFGNAVYTVNVSFTLDSEKFFIDTLNISINAVETYSSETTVIVYTQSDDTALRITEDSEYGIDDIMPTEFIFKDVSGNAIGFTNGVSDMINASVTEYNGIEIIVSAPENGLLSVFGEIIPVIKDKDGNAVEGSKAYAYYSADTSKVVVDFHVEGVYYVNIPIGENTYVVPINARWKTPTADDFTPVYYGATAGTMTEEMIWIHTEELSVYTGQNILLRADIADGCKPDMFTAVIKDNSSDAVMTSSSSQDYTYDGKNDLVYTFTASKPGTYTVVLTSTSNSAVSKEITLNVLQAPEISELTVGKWTYSHNNQWGQTIDVVLNFYPTDGVSGTVTVDYSISSYGGNSEIYHIVYSYIVEKGELKITWVSETCTLNGVTAPSTEYNGEDCVLVNESYLIEFNGHALKHASTEPDSREN